MTVDYIQIVTEIMANEIVHELERIVHCVCSAGFHSHTAGLIARSHTCDASCLSRNQGGNEALVTTWASNARTRIEMAMTTTNSVAPVKPEADLPTILEGQISFGKPVAGVHRSECR